MNRFALLFCLLFAHVCFGSQTVCLVIDGALDSPPRHAVDRLIEALKQRGYNLEQDAGIDTSARMNLVIGVAGRSQTLDQLMARHNLEIPSAAESLRVARLADESTVLITGRDPRGLAYAVYEVAESIRLASADDPLDSIRQVSESPHLRTRSVTTQIFNEDVERSWYESEDYWRWYFEMMARNRFNNYSLTFGHNTNYMIPPYAWLFEVPEYPEVQVEGVSETRRAENLHRLQRISAIAREYGVDFTIGLWTQLPVVKVRVGLDFGPSPVRGLPEGMAGGDYCAKGLRRLLQLCPDITGVQLRMNLESGIPHNQQEAYYKAQFDAITTCGRPVRLDLRYKSLSQRTIDLAKAAGLDVTVSTKYWCEHMGLPYHPACEDPAYAASRYGYGSMLHYPRNYRVTYRLWTVGTSRLLLWGDPNYAARFAESCRLGGGEGFEIFAPLTNKGYGNEPGAWNIFTDESLVSTQWEYQRYWPYFLSFGRWGYNPKTPDAVWRRQMVEHFGKAGRMMDRAYRQASQILPLITATTQFSAGNWRFWPEMIPCMHLDAYRAIQPSDYAQFYAIAPFSSRQHWRGEGWAAKHSAFVEDVLAGNLNSKTTPIQVSRMLDDLANQTLAALDAAASSGVDLDTPEFRATALDLRVLAHLARYHAEKKHAAVHLEFFRLTNDKARLPLVYQHIRRALAQWEQIVQLTDGKYNRKMVLGFSPAHNSDFPDRLHDHTGTWKDRLPQVRADVAFAADLMRKNAMDPDADYESVVPSIKRYPGETPPKSCPVITHEPVLEAAPGRDLELSVKVTSEHPLRDVSVYFRPMDQTRAWKRIAMTRTEDGAYAVVIPGSNIDPRFNFLYYLEAREAHGGTFWPDWQQQTPYIIVKVQRSGQ